MHELKILSETDDHAIIGGYGVVYGGADLDGETFTAETDFMLDLVPEKLAFIDHSEDTYVMADGKRVKLMGIDEPVGRVIEVMPDDTGLYMRLQVEKSNRYWRIVESMLATGKAGLSSGTIGHLARREGKTITRWPIVEESITLTPAEPRTVGSVRRLKHVVESNPELEAVIPQATTGQSERIDLAAATDDAVEGEGKATIEIADMESEEMSGENVTDPRDAEIKALSERVNQMIELMEKSPALKSAGYTTDDGGAADPAHKSFGDYLLAIKRGDTKRLGVVYGATKDMAEGSGVTGGYLVPSEFHNELLRVTAEQSPIYARVRKQPVNTDAGEYPALDTFVAPTAGSGETAAAGGVKAKTKAETAVLDETEPKFTNLEYRIHKVGGYVEVSNELIADSPQSIEALLRSLFGIAIGSKNERNILRGTGAGEPLGIFNAPCTIGVTTVTNDVFAYADVLAMWARFKACLLYTSRCV